MKRYQINFTSYITHKSTGKKAVPFEPKVYVYNMEKKPDMRKVS